MTKSIISMLFYSLVERERDGQTIEKKKKRIFPYLRFFV